MLTPGPFVGMGQAGMLSPTGRCRAFDQSADGMVPGEAVAAVVLRRLEDAERDGDPIYATILADAINYDDKTSGITAPSRSAQARLTREVIGQAGVDPSRIGHIVTHGTGTPLGDPAEINGLVDALSDFDLPLQNCALTSTKSNVGHTFAASGLVSLIALTKGLNQRVIPPSLFCERASDRVQWQDLPVYVNTRLADWKTGDGALPIGVVSSFGMSGTNAQVLVQDYRPLRSEPALSDPQTVLLVLSAKSQAALQANAAVLANALEKDADLARNLAGVSHTLAAGRAHFRHRCALVVGSAEDAVLMLRQIAGGHSDGLTSGVVDRNFEPDRAVLRQVANIRSTVASSCGEASRRVVLEQLAGFYCLGYTDAADTNPPGTPRLHLPGYEFARTEYWAEADRSVPPALPEAIPSALETGSSETSFYEPVWTAVDDAQAVTGGDLTAAEYAAETDVQLWWFGPGHHGPAVDTAFTCHGYEPHERFSSLAAQLLETAQSVISERRKRLFAQLVLCGEDAAVFSKGCSAMLRTISQEFSFFDGQVIELTSTLPEAELTRLLDQERKRKSDTLIRSETRIRHRLEWRRCDPPQTRPVWRENGIYLITGGAGGIGRQMAQCILGAVPTAKIVLCGRSDRGKVGPTDIAGVANQPHYLSADIADPGSVERLVETIVQTYGGLHGVQHCAGVNDDGLIMDKSEETLQRVLRPKVDGAVLLDRATKDLTLDLFVLFSSTSAVFGNAGQIDYAAANGFLDGFAGARDEQVKLGLRHGRTVSINWPLWKDGGMGVSAGREDVLRQRFGLVPLDARTGFAAMNRALSMSSSQVLVM